MSLPLGAPHCATCKMGRSTRYTAQPYGNVLHTGAPWLVAGSGGAGVAGRDLLRGHRQPGRRRRQAGADRVEQQQRHRVPGVGGERPLRGHVGQRAVAGLPGGERQQRRRRGDVPGGGAPDQVGPQPQVRRGVLGSAYATLAAQGTYCVPYVITQVTDVAGKAYGGQARSCRQVLDPNLANELTSMLQTVVQGNGTASGAVPLSNSRPIAGKTGTTDQGVATWFDGYTPGLAAATWTGYINWNDKTRLADIKIGPTYYSGQIFGANISAPTFNDAMTGALAGTAVQGFVPPTGFNQPSTPPPGKPGKGPGGANGGNGQATVGGLPGGFIGGLIGGNGGNH